MSGAANPFLFVVGCPRSGTTLMQRILDRHPSLAVANDTHFISRALERFAPESLGAALAGRAVPLSERLVQAAIDYRRFPRLGIDEREARAIAASCSSYAEFVGALYGRFAELRGKSFGGEKTPDYVRRLPLLTGLFPAARIVHLIRDGRDVTMSLVEWATGNKGPAKLALWRDEPMGTGALWWRWQVLAGRRSAIGLRGRYLEVRYDDLVERTAETLQSVVSFLGIADDAALRSMLEATTAERPASARKAERAPIRGLRDWRTQMAERDVELFEAIAGDLLEELGMVRHARRCSRTVQRAADRCNEWWAGYVAGRVAKARGRGIAPHADLIVR